MNSMFKMTLASVLAVLTLSVTVAISATPVSARAGGGPYWGGHHGPNGPSPSQSGTNKQTCKQNGEGCLRQK